MLSWCSPVVLVHLRTGRFCECSREKFTSSRARIHFPNASVCDHTSYPAARTARAQKASALFTQPLWSYSPPSQGRFLHELSHGACCCQESLHPGEWSRQVLQPPVCLSLSLCQTGSEWVLVGQSRYRAHHSTHTSAETVYSLPASVWGATVTHSCPGTVPLKLNSGTGDCCVTLVTHVLKLEWYRED